MCEKIAEGLSLETQSREDPLYPPEFLSSFKDTAFHALKAYLERTAAPTEVLGLLEDLVILTTYRNVVENGGKVSLATNQFMVESVASASRNIAAIGGVFYSPSGPTVSRLPEGENSDLVGT